MENNESAAQQNMPSWLKRPRMWCYHSTGRWAWTGTYKNAGRRKAAVCRLNGVGIKWCPGGAYRNSCGTSCYSEHANYALSGLITGIRQPFPWPPVSFYRQRAKVKRMPPNPARACLSVTVVFDNALSTVSSNKYMFALVTMLITVVVIIAAFNYYISVAKRCALKHRFLRWHLSALVLRHVLCSGINCQKCTWCDI